MKNKNDAICSNCGNLEIECKCVWIKKPKTKQSNNEYEKLSVDFNLVAFYLLDNNDKYFNIAREDAENLFRNNKKEFYQLLQSAQTDSDETDERIIFQKKLKMIYGL